MYQRAVVEEWRGTYSVPQPVGSSRETNTSGADGEGENLADDNPGTRTPGRGEEEDEDGDEGNLGVDGRDVVGNGVASSIEVGLVETDSDTNDGDEELADQHAESSVDEQRAATEALNRPERQRGGADVDKGEDERDQEGVLDGTCRLQEGSRVVEDEVDTGPLLHHLQRSTENGAAKVGASVPEGALEAVGPRAEPGGVGDQLTLVLLVGDDLSKLDLDVLRVLGLATKARQRIGGLEEVAALDEVTRRVGKKHETTAKDQSPSELDGNGNAVSTSVVAALGSVDDNRSQHDTNGDAELVTSDQGTTDLARAL
jgi:hypothetical protein